MGIEYRIAKGHKENFNMIILEARRNTGFEILSDLDRILTRYAQYVGRNIASQEFVPNNDQRKLYILNPGVKPSYTEKTDENDIALMINLELDRIPTAFRISL